MSIWQQPSIGLDNDLAQNDGELWRQAIVWTNADPIHWSVCVVLGGDELNTELIKYTMLAANLYKATVFKHVLVQHFYF